MKTPDNNVRIKTAIMQINEILKYILLRNISPS